MIVAGVDDLLFLDLGMGDVVNKSPTDAATRTSVDESVLRTCVEGILAVNEFGMKYYVSLLTLRLQVGQTLPVYEVFCACDTCCGSSCREVAGLCVVMTLSTENALNPTLLVGCEYHTI